MENYNIIIYVIKGGFRFLNEKCNFSKYCSEPFIHADYHNEKKKTENS